MAGPGGINPGGMNPGGDGMLDEPQTPQEELDFYTGELGTKLLTKLKAKLDAGTFGLVLKDASKAVPLVLREKDPNNNAGGFAGAGGMRPPAGMMPAGMMPMPGGGPMPGSGEDGDAGAPAAGLSGQLIPGLTLLGVVENVKELTELVAATPVDVVFIFDVKVRPATASNWVNNDTRLRVAPAAKITEALYTSKVINNKGATEARKKKGGEDPVNQEITSALAAVESGSATLPGYKLEALPPAVTSEVALKRIQALAAAKPDNALPLLLEARFYVAKKLLKPEEMMTIAMTEVSEDQLGDFSSLLDGEDVREKISVALKGPGGDKPKTVLGKFGDALLGAGGLGGLVPQPELPPIGLPTGIPGVGNRPVPGANGAQSPAPAGSSSAGSPVRGGLAPMKPVGPLPMPGDSSSSAGAVVP